jgi:hypothetical protein
MTMRRLSRVSPVFWETMLKQNGDSILMNGLGVRGKDEGREDLESRAHL